MEQPIKLGDRVSYKGEPGIGIIGWINGMGTHVDIHYVLGVKLGCKTEEVKLEPRLKKYPQSNPPEFFECDTCAAKPGTPELCPPCYHNRSLIDRLKDQIKKLKGKT